MLKSYHSWTPNPDLTDSSYITLQQAWVDKQILALNRMLKIELDDFVKLRQCLLNSPIENLDTLFLSNKYYQYYTDRHKIKFTINNKLKK